MKYFNTPSSKNVKKLFKDHLGMPDITQDWHWQNMTPKTARDELDRIVGIRHSLVHRGEQYSTRRLVQPTEVPDAVLLIEQLAIATAGSLGVSEWEEFKKTR